MANAPTPIPGSGQNWAGASSERRPELDSLRGLAAFMVLIQHAQLTVPPIDTPDVPGAGFLRWILFDNTPLRILDVGRPAVLFFFVLSGYVLTRALLKSGSPGLLSFAAQRTIRLMLPVAVSVLLSVLLYFLFFEPAFLPELRDRTLHTWHEPPSLEMILGNILLLSTAEHLRLNIPLWSLVHEWRLTVFLPLVLLFRGRPLQLLLMALILMLAGQVLGAGENGIQLGKDLQSSIASTLYFALAVGAGVALALMPSAPQPGGRECLVLLLIAAALFSMKSDLAIYAGSVILIVVAQQPGIFRWILRRSAMVWLGRISFSLYLVHVPILVATAYALHGVASPIPTASIGCVIALLAAAVMRAAVEEPSRKLARRVQRSLSREPMREGTLARTRS